MHWLQDVRLHLTATKVEGAILQLTKRGLKAPVISEDKNGTRKNVGGGKASNLWNPAAEKGVV
ncbi:MAG: hypothetical protein ACU83P_13475 [Gammaproteobacteria bacterium]